MIKLACNYLNEVVELLNEDIIKIDYLKYPSLGSDSGFNDFNIYEKRIIDAKLLKPLLHHGNYPSSIHICNKNFITDFDLETFKNTCNLSETKGISLHFTGASENDSKEDIIQNSIRNINFLKSYFKHMEFISIENLTDSYNPHLIDPDVISEVVDETDIYFLYDISHAYKASLHLNLSFSEYVMKLPLHKTYEIHINGWYKNSTEMQSHMKINEESYEHLEHILINYPVKIVTLEYGRTNDRLNSGCPIVSFESSNPQAKIEIIDQLKRLKKIISKVERVKYDIKCKSI